MGRERNRSRSHDGDGSRRSHPSTVSLSAIRGVHGKRRFERRSELGLRRAGCENPSEVRLMSQRTVAACRLLQRAVAVMAIVAIVPAAARAQEAAAKSERGERILTAACLTCHDNRHVDTQALDEAAWTKMVQSEIERGAKVSAD